MNYIKIMLAGLLFATIMPSLASAETLFWTIDNDFSRTVSVEFYSQDRNHVWPGNGQVYVIDPNEGDEPPTGESDPEAIAELNEQRAIIQAEIKEFSLKNRLVFGYWLLSYSYHEIQRVLRFDHGIESSVNEIGVIVNRCKKRLITAISKKGLA